MEMSDFYDSFFEEAEELLEDMEKHLLDLNPDEPDMEQLNAIFRAAHSIKGGAGAFGFNVLQETTHILENVLDHAREGRLPLGPGAVDVFLKAKDTLQEQISAHRQGGEPDGEAAARIGEQLKQLEREEVEGIAAEDSGGEGALDGSGSRAGEEGDGGNEDPLDRIARDLQRIAREYGETGMEKSPSGEEAGDEDGGEDPAGKLLVTLLNVGEKDRELLLEELGHLGEVIESGGDDKQFEVTLLASVDAGAIEAVMCFIIEPEQLTIRTIEAPDPETPAQERETAEEAHTEAAEETMEKTEIREETEAAGQAPESSPASGKPASASAGGKAGADAKSARSTESSSIRVPVDKVDQIINLVGELIITQSMLDQTAEGLDDAGKRALTSGLTQLQRTARDLQESVMSIRMLPMDYVFSRFPRQVRDLAGKLGKEVELVTEGKSTELDKGLIERITDPLTHLVRNSLDHGIETPDIRAAAGKPRGGRLQLSARHQGSSIVIEVSDDGGGLNREKLLAKARGNGLDVSDDMSDDEVWQLIFAPGFSTADEVSDVSGRGVGMDVVKRNIQSMGGQVEIASTPGQGTSIRVVLPLTLAVLDGMSLRVGEEMFVLPLGAVSELIQPAEEDLFTMAGDDVLLKVRDEYLPVVALHQVMNVPGAITDMARSIAVIVHDEERSYALLVDEPVGQQQVVVKNLESNYRRVPGVSAATILGDGRVALILDPVGLHRCEHARKKHQAGNARQPRHHWEEVETT